MDLVAGVRKEGSRGGRGEFKWDDVRDSQHRENYLGHSLMAPVGRWQKNKDLNWYAKGDTTSAAEARKEEIRRIKEAEESALSEALGYGPTIRSNANETPIGQKEVEKAIKETAEGDEEEAKGVGFGAFVRGPPVKEESDLLRGEGLGRPSGGEVTRERRRDSDGRKENKRRSRSRDRCISLGRGHIADRWIGREKSTRIEGNGQSAMRGEEMMTGHRAGGGSVVIHQIHLDGGEVREIEMVITEDEEDVLEDLHVLENSRPRDEAAIHAQKRSKLTDRPY
ncbi:MAG: hypothetical protein ALECFALPRED_002463 [Alectoria fallacina]|uniref:Multiple myeloma tumor-associated protein 2-like N-terminal domain-containing protein n=1 Tax=Alectoria fallacina TaxID=1903189 RepID=A0A8H3EM68_9LECA|nr:MAG: hypothetical protein ALECFALPRED_002463 [Alectoria fallacina]